jgi:hypothetical protein
MPETQETFQVGAKVETLDLSAYILIVVCAARSN